MGGGDAVGVVVVTHDSRATILACLAALREQAGEVVVVDTASGDGTAKVVEDAGIPVLRGPNRGFGAACNAGAASLDTEFLLFQNPDTVIAPGSVRALVEAHRARPPGGRRAALGPLFEGEDLARKESYLLWSTSLGLAVRRRLLPRREPPALAVGSRSVLLVPRLSGASLLVRREDFRDVGGFDEDFFLYFEDADLSLRLRARGVLLAVVPEARVRHDAGSSTAGRADIDVVRCRSALLLARKHRGRAGRAVVAVDLVVMSVLGAALELARGRRPAAARRLGRLRALRGAAHDPRSPSR